MNTTFLLSLFSAAVTETRTASAPAQRPRLDAEPAPVVGRRNRYARRDIGRGYGDSAGYIRNRSFLATPSLSRYR